MSDQNTLNIEWVKCPHGIEKRQFCKDCQAAREEFKSILSQKVANPLAPRRIAILRGCHAKDGCFCSGACKEIIGYRDPIYPGERE